jgi:hypothetical protein
MALSVCQLQKKKDGQRPSFPVIQAALIIRSCEGSADHP